MKKPSLPLFLDWRRWVRTFLSGLFVLLPIVVTFAIIMWVIGVAEAALGGLVKVLVPGSFYLPGMGLIAALVLIFLVGLLTQAIFFRQILQWLDEQLESIPMVKTVYSAVKDLTGFISRAGDGKKRMGQVVLIQIPNIPVRLLGFVTLEDLASAGLPASTDNEPAVAVYLPMSYQIGGYTMLLPRSYLTPLNMGMEEAMRFVITAGLSHADEERKKKNH